MSEARNQSDGAKHFGAPASIRSFEDSLKKAVEKALNLNYSKEAGTTPHGLRHMYAYTLRALGVDEKVIQEGLRHRHPYSQRVYGNPTPSDINEQIKMCMQKSRDSLPDGVQLERSLRWLEDRYPELKILKGGLLK
ncbi:MAG: tyrosine-type recombinase/integrase [Pedobacter sp.]